MNQIQLEEELKELDLIQLQSRKEDADIVPTLKRLNGVDNEVLKVLPSPGDAGVICMDKVMTINEIVYDEQVQFEMNLK